MIGTVVFLVGFSGGIPASSKPTAKPGPPNRDRSIFWARNPFTLNLSKGDIPRGKRGQVYFLEGTLRKLVHLKFGAIPSWADEQLKVATDEQLNRWVTGILEAESLEALLGVS